MLGDLHRAFRTLARDRGLSTVAILSLAIGIATNTTVFSLIYAVEFPALAYPAAWNIVFLETDHRGRGLEGMLVSVPDALDAFAASRTLTKASVAADHTAILETGGGRIRVSGRTVTAGFFDTFEMPAARGRVLAPVDAPGTVVISDQLWRTHFAAADMILGHSVRVEAEVWTIVGVMPPGFDPDADFWAPMPAATRPRDDRQYSAFARLAGGASLEDASAELSAVSQSLAQAHPGTNTDWILRVLPLSQLHGRDSRQTFFLLQAAVALMLLVACANIANILLARGTQRQTEMALRLSLGATRKRLITQVLTESVVLAIIGGLIGVILALWGVRAARALGGFPDVIEPTINVGVLSFSVVLSIVTGLICGVLPALRASAVTPALTLRKDAGRGNTVTGSRLRDGLVALQIVGAVVLTTTGSLLVQSWLHRQQVDLGFDPAQSIQAHLLDLNVNAVPTLLDALAARPGVEAVGVTAWALPTPSGAQQSLTRDSGSAAPLDPSVPRVIEAVSPDYLRARGIPLRAGRSLDASDRSGGEPVAMINEALASRLWGDAGPVGTHLRLGPAGDPAALVVRIVGVVGTTRRSAAHTVAVARVYVPFAQFPATDVQVVMRGAAVDGLPGTLRAVAREVAPQALVENVMSVEADLAQFLAPARLMTVLLSAFGVAGLLLAALGVFGTTSYVVSLRAREFAVRIALGATRRHVLELVFRTAFVPTLVGLVAGILIAVAASHSIQAFLFEVSPIDWPTLMGVAAMLWLVSAIACYRPASAASHADPMSILRRH